jgi:hypothetical protein
MSFPRPRHYFCASEIWHCLVPRPLCSRPRMAPPWAIPSPALCAITVVVVASPAPASFRRSPPSGAYKKASISSISPHTGLGHSPSPSPSPGLNRDSAPTLTLVSSPLSSILVSNQASSLTSPHRHEHRTPHPTPNHTPRPRRQPHHSESPATSLWSASSKPPLVKSTPPLWPPPLLVLTHLPNHREPGQRPRTIVEAANDWFSSPIGRSALLLDVSPPPLAGTWAHAQGAVPRPWASSPAWSYACARLGPKFPQSV